MRTNITKTQRHSIIEPIYYAGFQEKINGDSHILPQTTFYCCTCKTYDSDPQIKTKGSTFSTT